LLELLINKQILTIWEVRSVLTGAIRNIGPRLQSPGGLAASQTIGELLLHFSEPQRLVVLDSTPSAVVSIQVFSNLLKRCIKALAKYNAIAIVLDERVSAEIVLVDRT
jgi:hypothetical protein